MRLYQTAVETTMQEKCEENRVFDVFKNILRVLLIKTYEGYNFVIN